MGPEIEANFCLICKAPSSIFHPYLAPTLPIATILPYRAEDQVNRNRRDAAAKDPNTGRPIAPTLLYEAKDLENRQKIDGGDLVLKGADSFGFPKYSNGDQNQPISMWFCRQQIDSDSCGCIPQNLVHADYVKANVEDKNGQKKVNHNCAAGFVPILGWVVGVHKESLTDLKRQMFQLTAGHQLFLWYEQITPTMKLIQDGTPNTVQCACQIPYRLGCSGAPV